MILVALAAAFSSSFSNCSDIVLLVSLLGDEVCLLSELVAKGAVTGGG